MIDLIESDGYEKPPHGWTCFHCGETFTDAKAAEDHFGRRDGVTPGCRIKAGAERGLLAELRRLEAENQRLMAQLGDECADVHIRMHEQSSRHQLQLSLAEELGYGRGLDDRREQVLPALVEMERCVDTASRLQHWYYTVAQALAPGRDALFKLGAELMGGDMEFHHYLKEKIK